MASINNLSNLAESLKDLQSVFSKADTSKNGSLSKAEFTKAVGDTSNTGKSVSELFTQLDADKNGEISKTELTEGASLAEKVQNALLMAQELMSGTTLMNMLGNKKSQDNGLFTSGTDNSSITSMMGGSQDSSADSTTSYIQSLIAKYNETAKDSVANASTTTKTEA